MITITVKDAEGNVVFELEFQGSDEFLAKAKLGAIGTNALLREFKKAELMV